MLKRVIEHPEQAPRIYGDVPSFMALPHQPPPALKDLDAVVLGMPFDGLATLRGGATRHAPAHSTGVGWRFAHYQHPGRPLGGRDVRRRGGEAGR